jgi:hypothetical protein
MRRAIGLTRASPSASADAAAGAAAATGSAADAPSGSKLASAGLKPAMNASISASDTAASANTAIKAPTDSVEPVSATMRRSVPATGASTEFTIFSVSTSSSGAPLASAAPGAACHSVMVPCCISMPHLGMVIGKIRWLMGSISEGKDATGQQCRQAVKNGQP